MTLIKSGARSARALLDQLLDRSSAQSLVSSLPVESVVRLIERVGLEDLGDVLALLSPEQLTHVLDRDLWRSEQPGRDEAFDAERFGLWLALWVEHSPKLAAKKLSELDFELVVLGVSQQLLVLDLEQLAQSMLRGAQPEDYEQLDKALENNLYHEFEQYRVVARDAGSFDAILALLVELNSHDYELFCDLIERCCALASEYIADNGGLFEVLSAPEMCEVDVSAAREERRDAQGYVAASSALAFLRLARETPWQELWLSETQDPITRAHLRSADSGRSVEPARSLSAAMAARHEASAPLLLLKLEALLSEEREPLRRLPPAKTRASLLTRALVALCERDPRRYERCVLEASYLANVVLAGIGTRELRFEPSAAAEVAFALCELGADESVRIASSRAQRLHELAERLAASGLVKLFQLGFHRMCAEELPRTVRRHEALARLREMLEAQGLARGVTTLEASKSAEKRKVTRARKSHSMSGGTD